jgi:hypothetical protein
MTKPATTQAEPSKVQPNPVAPDEPNPEPNWPAIIGKLLVAHTRVALEQAEFAGFHRTIRVLKPVLEEVEAEIGE